MAAYVKYCVDASVQMVNMYDLEFLFGKPQTIALEVAVLSAIVTYAISELNYKQISYVARALMVLTVLVLFYITVVIFYKAYYMYLFSPIESIITIDSNNTL